MRPRPWCPLADPRLLYREKLVNEIAHGLGLIQQGVKLCYLVCAPVGGGKTSVLLSVAAAMRERGGPPVIYADCAREILTPDDLSSLIRAILEAAEVKARPGDLLEMTKLAEMGHHDKAIRLVDRLLGEAGRCAVLLLDEPSAMAGLSRFADMRGTPASLLSALVDADNIGLVVTELSPERARRMLGRAAEALTVKEIPRLRREEGARLMARLVGERAVMDRGALALAHEMAGGLPLHLHMLAMAIMLSGETEVDEERLQDLVARGLEDPSSVLAISMRLLHHLILERVRGGGMAVRVLLAVAEGCREPRELARRLGRPYQYVGEYVRRFVEARVLLREDGMLRFGDALYPAWLLAWFSRPGKMRGSSIAFA